MFIGTKIGAMIPAMPVKACPCEGGGRPNARLTDTKQGCGRRPVAILALLPRPHYKADLIIHRSLAARRY